MRVILLLVCLFCESVCGVLCYFDADFLWQAPTLLCILSRLLHRSQNLCKVILTKCFSPLFIQRKEKQTPPPLHACVHACISYSASIDGHNGYQRPAMPPDQTVSVNVSHEHRGACAFSSRASGGRKTHRPRYARWCAFNWAMAWPPRRYRDQAPAR
jgi:hypothetical protein